MKNLIDNELLKELLLPDNKEHLLKRALVGTNQIKADEPFQIDMDWTSFLTYIGCEGIFENWPAFDETNPIYILMKSNLSGDKNALIDLYDHLFAECLTLVQSFPQIDQSFLIERIIGAYKHYSVFPLARSLANSLDYFAKEIKENPYQTLHNLILYLAWDRMCVSLAAIFENAESSPGNIEGLYVLRDCLIESFNHITLQGKSYPSFWRLVEALFALYMREDHLKLHSETEWLILCQGATSLGSRKMLTNAGFIDHAIYHMEKQEEGDADRFFSIRSAETLLSAVNLAKLVNNKIKKETPYWNFLLHPMKMFTFTSEGELIAV